MLYFLCKKFSGRLKMSKATIVWTKIDEAPALATYSLLPIMRAF
ncbi:MAG: NADP-dependent isocitrate dehydrogenase, partial [Sulfurihydrogenibium sp.]|nr:NADP-dependent isocitrate dehydrogenase [Sulfurihydrogenibium sp.]